MDECPIPVARSCLQYQFDFTLDNLKFEPQVFCDLHKEANRAYIPDALAAMVPLDVFRGIPDEMQPLTEKHFVKFLPVNIGTATQLGLSDSSFSVTFYAKLSALQDSVEICTEATETFNKNESINFTFQNYVNFCLGQSFLCKHANGLGNW